VLEFFYLLLQSTNDCPVCQAPIAEGRTTRLSSAGITLSELQGNIPFEPVLIILWARTQDKLYLGFDFKLHLRSITSTFGDTVSPRALTWCGWPKFTTTRAPHSLQRNASPCTTMWPCMCTTTPFLSQVISCLQCVHTGLILSPYQAGYPVLGPSRGGLCSLSTVSCRGP